MTHDEEQATEQERAVKEQERWMGIVRRVMKRDEGRELVYVLLERCKVFGSSMTTGEVVGMAFNEGRRSIGLQLMAEVLESAPESYMQTIITMKERSSDNGKYNY